VYLSGYEYDWLGSDADGHVALFSTAGFGFAPDTSLRRGTDHEDAIAAILITRASTTARFAPDLAAGLENTWRLMAERGLYAFDWDHARDRYILVAAPGAPTGLNALPLVAAIVARQIAFPRLHFANLTEFTENLVAG
jgi:hypothetical protein